jgi:hypothetical protein
MLPLVVALVAASDRHPYQDRMAVGSSKINPIILDPKVPWQAEVDVGGG